MNFLIPFVLILGTIIFMEGFSWFLHKYILHGPLWFLHKTHHRVNHSWWEANDIVSVAYGLIAVGLILYGGNTGHWMQWIGWGITLYGLLYFTLHDIIIHRRIKMKYKFKSKYIKRLIRAHKIHHKHLQKEDSEAFGFLYAPQKYEPK